MYQGTYNHMVSVLNPPVSRTPPTPREDHVSDQSNTLIRDHPAPFVPSFHPHPYSFLSNNNICSSASTSSRVWDGVQCSLWVRLTETGRCYRETQKHQPMSIYTRAGKTFSIHWHADTHTNKSMKASQEIFSTKRILLACNTSKFCLSAPLCFTSLFPG